MKYVLRFLLGIVLFLVVVALSVVLFTVTPLASTAPGQAVQSLLGLGQNAVTNVALDASGIKGTIDDELRDNASAIAAQMGLSEDEVLQAIDDLDIENWSVTSLPSDAQVSSTQSVTYGGVAAEITTYDDPSYITVEVQGQTITLAVPDSAQDSKALLSYL